MALLIALASVLGSGKTAAAATEPFLGEIAIFAGNFAPRGWARCDGQLLSISQNSALFSILGTTYGGDGRTTFGLPDLRGRVPIHAGGGPGLTARRLGEKGGQETVAQGAPVKAAAATEEGTNSVSVLTPEKATNMQPYLTVYYIIATQGVFPSRN